MSFLSSFNQNIKYILNVCTHHRKRVFISLFLFSFIGICLYFFRTSIFQSATITGPVAYWKLDEGQGLTTQDQTTNNNDGTMGIGTGASAPSWITEDQCISGKCLRFDGSDDFVSIADNTILEGMSALTINVWAKPTSCSGKIGSDVIMVRKTNAYSLGIDTTCKVSFYIHNGTSWSSEILSSSTITTNQWSHIVAVYTGSAYNIYINGKVAGTGTPSVSGSINSNTENVTIGSWVPDFSYAFKGFIDDVKIYDYVRTADQIKQDFTGVASSKGAAVVLGANDPGALSDGLVGYWKMNEGVGTTGPSWTAIDSSGNGNNGRGVGDAGPGTGKFGNGGSFDGNGDYIGLGTSFPNLGETFTLTGWFKPDSVSGDPTLFARHYFSTLDWRIAINSTNSKIDADITYDGNENSAITARSNNAVTTGSWNQFALIKTTTSLTVYLNGQAGTPVTTSGDVYQSAGGVQTTIGIRQDGSQDFDGTVDEYRVYNRALSQNEVTQLYNFAPGPVGYWTLDETSGTRYDSSGNANNLTINSETYSATGKFNQAADFENKPTDNSQSIEIDDASQSGLDITGPVTVESWIKVESTAGDAQGIVGKDGGSGFFGYSLKLHSTDALRFSLSGNGTAQTHLTGNTTLQTGKWYHAAAVYDGTNMILYLNGVIDGTTAFSGSIFDHDKPFAIGGRGSFGTTDTFDGLIDDVRVYNYARTQAQIQQDMNAGHPAVGTPVGSTVLHLKMDDGYGGTTQDWSPQNNDALLGNIGSGSSAPTWTNDGKFGKALYFDGTNDYVNVADANSLDVSTGFSITTWIKQTAAKNTFIMNKDGVTSQRSFAFQLGSNGLLGSYIFKDDSTYTQIRGTNTVPTGQWNHVVLTYDAISDVAKLYINGKSDDVVYVANTAGNVQTTTSPVLIGGRFYAASPDFYNGLMDEVKLYPFVLTPEEVKVDMNQGKQMVLGSKSTESNGTTYSNSSSREYCIPGDTSTCNAPVAEWKMDEGTGLSINDTSGNSNTGTMGVGTGDSAPFWVNGKFGNGLKFDGSDDIIAIPGSNSINMDDENFTFSAWFKTDDTNPQYKTIISNYNGNSEIIQLSLNSSNQLYWETRDSANALITITTSGAVNDGKWHYAVGVRNTTDNMSSLYLDGLLVSSSSDTRTGDYTSATNSNRHIISGRKDPATSSIIYRFPGLIDQVRIYDYARTDAQIAWEYNRGTPITWLKMNECSGTDINNWTPDANGAFRGNNAVLTIGSDGTNTAGTCSTSGAWFNGATGKFDASIALDGSDDYVTISDPSDGSLDFVDGEDFTITMWLKLQDKTSFRTLLSKKTGNAAGNIGYLIHIFASETLGMYTADGTDQNLTSTNQGVPVDTWTHVTIVYDDDTAIKFYFNGQDVTGNSSQDALNLVDDIANVNDFRLAAESGTAEYFMGGQVDDLRVYRYALNQTQIKEVMNQRAITFR